MKLNIIDESMQVVRRTESEITDIRAKLRERDILFAEHLDKFKEYSYKIDDHIQFTSKLEADHKAIKTIVNKLDQTTVQK